MDVVIVESPAKAKTINKYLGKNYTVLASYGHVRDLPGGDKSVDPDHDFDMTWEVDHNSEKHLKEIVKATRGAKHLYLATDPDREGEAISWHVREVLENRKALTGVNVQRIVFHEVTQEAVLQALNQPRNLDSGLIEAYLARRALDRLFGFKLSGILRRKVPGSQSAGRVQSVALRIISERETEIEKFTAQEYWSIKINFNTPEGASITSRLIQLNGEKLDRFSLASEKDAVNAEKFVEEGNFRVVSVKRKSISQNPKPPFTTSTLQQEASRKLGFSASRTMRIAQRLYEGIDIGGETVGVITYMRTDSVQMAEEAIKNSRTLIHKKFGPKYVPEKPNVYRTQTKNAQEAHEAIRPTDFAREPNHVSGYLDSDGQKLYQLIWKRAVASSMQRAALEQVTIDAADVSQKTIVRATGSVIKFDGFRTLYQEDDDDPSEEDDVSKKILPNVEKGNSLTTQSIFKEQHFTKPPPRYTEASLVRKLEQLGIGRPSTYAFIISVLQDRNYVRLEKRRFTPEDRGRVVTAFLAGYFEQYIQYNFTAELEDRLDNVANGNANWKHVLREFWEDFYSAIKNTENLRISDVIDTLDQDLDSLCFPSNKDDKNSRICPTCKTGRLGLRLGKSGPFIGCSNYPDCKFTRPLSVESEEDETIEGMSLPKHLGQDPETKKDVLLCKGPFGFYIQLGGPEGKIKPKRVTLIRNIQPSEVTLPIAIALLSLPRDIGLHPESGETIQAGVGRYGPYLKVGRAYTSLGKEEDVLSIGLNRALTILNEKPNNSRTSASTLRELGLHPEDGKPITLRKGRYGPYVKHGRLNASLPNSEDEKSINLGLAVQLLKERAAKGKAKNRKNKLQ